MIELFARSPGMREAMGLAERVSSTDANVLITGESGAGKDVLASWIHWQSPRAAQPLVKIDCATLPGELLEAVAGRARVVAYEDLVVTEPKPAAVQRICAVRS